MNKKLIFISILAGLVITMVGLIVVDKSNINLDVITVDVSGLLDKDSSEPKYIGELGGGICIHVNINKSYSDHGFPATSVAKIDSISCAEIVETAYKIYILGFIFNWVLYSVLFGLIILLLSNIIKIISWKKIKSSITKRKSLILCLLIGLVLTSASLLYSASYNPFNSQKLLPIITPFSIRLEEPKKDYIDTDFNELGITNQGLALITNHGYPAVIISSNNYLYPLGFIINWVSYSAIVGVGMVGIKKLKSNKRRNI